MTQEEKQNLANSFPQTFTEAQLGIEISGTELKVFENGVWANSMDEKWHIFVLNEVIYFVRSWTNYCIYKVFLQRRDDKVLLTHFHVNRSQYRSNDIEFDTVMLKKLLQMYLKREDIYVDPKLDLPLISQTVLQYDPNNDYKKSIGSNDVGVTKSIYNGFIENSQGFATIDGWDELSKKLQGKPDREPLISLHMQHRKLKTARTFYFSQDATELLGEIVITTSGIYK